MSELLSAVSTVSLKSTNQAAATKVVAPDIARRNGLHTSTAAIDSLEAAHAVLKSQPGEEQAKAALSYLLGRKTAESSILIPSSQSSPILRTLISHTLTDIWNISPDIQELLKHCLTSVPGLQGLLSELRATATSDSKASKGPEHVACLEQLLADVSLPWQIWVGLLKLANEAQRRLLWNDFTRTVATGKVITTVAQWLDTRRSNIKPSTPSWLADGGRYTRSLGSAMAYMARQMDDNDDQSWSAAAVLLSRCSNIGYHASLADVLLQSLAIPSLDGLRVLATLISKLRVHDQSRLFTEVMLAKQRHLEIYGEAYRLEVSTILVSQLLGIAQLLRPELVLMLGDPTKCAVLSRISRRAILCVLADDKSDLQSVLVANIKIFGEMLFIQHTPMSHQEICAENTLLAAAQLQHLAPSALVQQVRSSAYMSAISGRLNASSDQARVLGMCVGMAISKAVDEGATQLRFDTEEMSSQWAKDLMDLIDSTDRIAAAENWTKLCATQEVKRSPGQNLPLTKSLVFKPDKPGNKHVTAISRTITPAARIVEVLDDDEDQDLVTYPKPDSDAEDSDDDPTLVIRDKPRAPVYIRDLIAGLGDSENHDRHRLALQHAAPLIRRKAQHGKDVADHAIELGMNLIGLQDHFELDNFVELRLNALIALLISDPNTIGPWLSRQAFEGDYSISQRGTAFSAIGLAARELAGYSDTLAQDSATSFPSKRLPDKYHAIYTNSPSSSASSPTEALNVVTTSLESAMLLPLAAAAADATTGPAALKVNRTFSSRIKTPPQRTTRIPNALAKQLAGSFFAPLLGNFHTATAGALAHHLGPSSSSSSSYLATDRGGGRTAQHNPFLSPHLLATFIRTLAVLLLASGPGTLSLPSLTGDFWALLLALRGQASGDPGVMHAVLFGLLALLEVNTGTADGSRRLAAECGREVVEAREWVGDVWARLPADNVGTDDAAAGGLGAAGRGGTGGRGSEAGKLRGLAAAVLVGLGEIVDRWQRLMVGELMQY